MSRALAAALAAAAVCALPAAASSQPLLIMHGSRTQPLVALTFDADMTEGMLQALRSGRVTRWYDPAILAELRAARAPATVFITGLWAETYPLVARSLARDPLFELENHSYDHAAWERPCYGLPSAPTRRKKRDEVRRGAFALAAVTGVAAAYFRFPGGCANRADVRLVATLGERSVQWDVISGDSYLRNPVDVERQVLDATGSGSIVVLHLVGPPNAPATAAALKEIIPRLRSRGLQFVKLRRLLNTARQVQPGA